METVTDDKHYSRFHKETPQIFLRRRLLGMSRVFGDAGFALHRLPDGHRISPEEFSEFGDAYSAFSSTRRFVDDLEEAAKTATSPVLVTEGAPTVDSWSVLPNCWKGKL